MIVRISDDNILLQTQAEAMGRIELAFAGAELAKLASDLHRADFVSTGDYTARSAAASREGVERVGYYVIWS